jgi:hypothetical protein
MPFNYQLAEIEDPLSKVNLATPATLAISNAVAAVLGIDAAGEFSRAVADN